ncbi:hypothetical protein BGX26_000379 [Mortierella sp. AD094]|nr:hypothetical protein BGX26_000379 [Mortierella sp. AD094]
MDDSITPFDIPLIVDLIVQHLDKKDYTNCIYVSKTFHELFKRYVWYNVNKRLEGDFDSWTELTPEYRKGILKNGQHIRKLSIAEVAPGELLKFLASPSSPCKNLLELTHTSGVYYPKTPHIYLAELVEKNIKLQKLRFRFEENGDERGTCSKLIDAIGKHSSLMELDVSVTYQAYYDYQEDFLLHLPKTLRTLNLDCYSVADAYEDEHEYNNSNDDEVGDGIEFYETLGAYPQLKSFTTSTRLNKREAPTIFSFIRGCPGLERFRTGDISPLVTEKLLAVLSDAQVFPNLTELHFGGATLVESNWRQLLNGMQGRIKSFSIAQVHFLPTPTSFIQAMTTQWAESLEVLRFWDYIELSSMDIELILSTCSKLTTFTISHNLDSFSQREDSSVEGLNALSGRENHGNAATWTCLGLKNLEIMFLDNFDSIVSDTDSVNELENDSEQREQLIVNGIESIYKKLGRLTKLQRLRIGWKSKDDTTRLDMSIKSGLKHMGGLKDLEVLDVSGINTANIGQEEVEWMVENWPNLWEIKGIFLKQVRDLFGMLDILDDEYEDLLLESGSAQVNEPAHFRWLKRQRPFSKTFHEQFKRYVWRDISKCLYDPEYTSSMLTPDHRKAILENGQYIRKLTIDEGTPGELLKYLADQSSPCKSLLELSHSAEEIYDYGSPRFYLAELVKNNIHLFSFTFEEYGEEAGLCSDLIGVIWKHPSLRELNTLTLKLDWSSVADGYGYEDEEDDESDEDDDDYDDEDDEDNYEALGVYPQLRSITSSWDVQKFPSLSKLHIEQATFAESDWRQLLNRTQGRIKSFSIWDVGFLSTPASFVQAMTAHWAESLEELLVKLGHDNRLGLDAWNMREEHGNAVTWACLGLENLEVMFLDNFDAIVTGNPNPDGATEPRNDSNQQKQIIVNGIESIYKKLGA